LALGDLQISISYAPCEESSMLHAYCIGQLNNDVRHSLEIKSAEATAGIILNSPAALDPFCHSILDIKMQSIPSSVFILIYHQTFSVLFLNLHRYSISAAGCSLARLFQAVGSPQERLIQLTLWICLRATDSRSFLPIICGHGMR
jgi:hypothetical protein